MNIPKCPRHNLELVIKTATKGKYSGQQFWGCPTWKHTKCNIIHPLTTEQKIELEENFQKMLIAQKKLSYRIKSFFKWLKKSYYVSGTSRDGGYNLYHWRSKTTNLQELLKISFLLLIIILLFISKNTAGIVLAIFGCIPLT